MLLINHTPEIEHEEWNDPRVENRHYNMVFHLGWFMKCTEEELWDAFERLKYAGCSPNMGGITAFALYHAGRLRKMGFCYHPTGGLRYSTKGGYEHGFLAIRPCPRGYKPEGV